MIRTRRKRVLSLFIVVCMMFTLLPMNNMKVLADEVGVEDSSKWNDLTKAVSGAAITLTTTNDTAIEAAMNAVDGGTVHVDYDADQGTKTSAVQDYVNKLLTEKALEVTAVVTHNGGDSYKVEFTNGLVSDEKVITMNFVLKYPLWVGRVQVTSENKDNITGPGIEKGTITYNPYDNTLTLNGATINCEESEIMNGIICKYGIWFWGFLNINLIGNNEIICEGESNTTSYGIYTTHRLTISGSGILNVDAGVTKSASTCYGIFGATGIIINGGEINVSAQSDGGAAGIYGDSVTISGGIIRSNATCTSDAVTGIVNGILADKDINISGGTVIATGAKMNGSYPAAYGLGGNVIITGGSVTAKAYGSNGNSNIAAINARFTYSNGSVKAGIDSEGTVLNDYDNSQLSTYRYISFEIKPEVKAKKIIESVTYTFTQVEASTRENVNEELVSKINSLSEMSETGITVKADDINIISFTSAVEGTSANPKGTDGRFTFTVKLSDDTVTVNITGTITATAYSGITDVQAVATAKGAVNDGRVTVDLGADQEAKTAAVQEYVNGLLTGDAAEVTAVVSHKIDNTYHVLFAKGSVSDYKDITMHIDIGYPLWVGGIQVTSANKDNIEGDGITGSVTYNPDTETLTLNNAVITGVRHRTDTYGYENTDIIYAKTGLNIVLNGNNSVTGSGERVNGIFNHSTKTLTISGTGSIDVKIGNDSNIQSTGIYSSGHIKILGGDISVSVKAKNTTSGIRASGNVYISGGTVEVEAIGGAATGIQGSPCIYIENATVKTTVSSDYGVRGLVGWIEIKSGEVSVIAESNKDAIGLTIHNETQSIIITGGIINVSATTKGNDSIAYGIGRNPKNVKISSGTVTIKADGNQAKAIDTIHQNFIFTDGLIKADTNPDGSKQVSYDPEQLENYKYIHYEYNPDFTKVNTAKIIIESGTYTIAQEVANTEESVKKELARQINGLTGMGETGITVTADNITIDSFTAAEAGTSANPDGTDGEFAFTVELRKGAETATASKTGRITATAYTGITDAQTVEAAKKAIKDGTVTVDFGAKQEAKTAAVQEYVDDLLTGDAEGVVAVVTHAGGDTYNVELSKGEVVDNITITMTVNERENPDIALVKTAKDLIEKAAYTVDQRVANSENDVKEKLADKINSLSGMRETEITVTADNITIDSFTAAEAGTSANPDGTDGVFTFTVTIRKGIVEKTTEDIRGEIKATAYTGITDAQAVEAAKNAIKDGTVTVDFGAKQEAKTAAVQEYADDLLTGDAEGVVAVVTHAGGDTYNVELSKGEVVDNITITMTVNERENPDIAPVNAAKELIEEATYTVAQRVANSENDVKAELVKQINSLSGMSGTGIVVKEDDIELDTFTAAIAGTSSNTTGTNGSFTFTVDISKGTTTDTTKSLSGIITATGYTPSPSPSPSPEPTPDPAPSPSPSPEPTPDPAPSPSPSPEPAPDPVPSPSPSPVPIPDPAPSPRPETTPVPTPAPEPKVSLKITETEIQAEVELTPDVIEHFNGQITLPIMSEDILKELKKEELSAVRVGLILPEQGDDEDRKKINLILESEMIQGAKDNKKDIIVDVKDSDNKVLYSWTFDKKELSNSNKKVADVNLSLKVEKATEGSPLFDKQKEEKKDKATVALVIDFAHEGVLPSQANVRIYVGNMEGITPGTDVYLYHYNIMRRQKSLKQSLTDIMQL